MRAQASAQLLANKHSQLAAEMDSLRSEKIRLAAKLSAELSEQQEKLRLQQETVDAIRFARTEHAARAARLEQGADLAQPLFRPAPDVQSSAA